MSTKTKTKTKAEATPDPAKTGAHEAVEAYFRAHPRFVTQHHLDSFNRFLDLRMKQTVQSLNPFVIPAASDAEVYIGGEDGEAIRIKPPPLTPAQCRADDLTYAADVTCDILVRFREAKTEHRMTDVLLLRLPVMLHSDACVLRGMSPTELLEHGECAYDQGGYFVVGGLEKVVVAQERGSTNRLFVKPVAPERNLPYSHEGRIRCLAAGGAVRSALFPKVLDFFVFSRGRARQHAVTVQMPGFSRPVPVCLLFRALGVESDRAIVQHVDEDDPHSPVAEFLRHSLLDAPYGVVRTQTEALEALRTLLSSAVDRTTDAVKYALVEDVFPTAGTRFDVKAKFLGDAVRKLILTVQGTVLPENRDDMRHKRLDVSGHLIANLFRDFYNRYRMNCTNTIEREYHYGPWKNTGDIQDLINSSNAHRIFDGGIVTEGFMRALRGNWQVAKSAIKMESIPGVAQDLTRVSYMSAMSHLRRLNTPLAAVKAVDPHRLHGSQWGYVCPVESPDGGSIGLLKNLAALAHVTFECGEEGVRRMLMDLGVQPVGAESTKPDHDQDRDGQPECAVFLNNVWFGTTRNPQEVTERARLYRRRGVINPQVSIRWRHADREIYVSTEGGRYCRPLLIIDPSTRRPVLERVAPPLSSWSDLTRGDVYDESYHRREATRKDERPPQVPREHDCCVEFLDAEETDGCLIAMTPADLDAEDAPRYTHLELHPSSILSFVAQAVPFAQHNQAPRNVLSCAQSKQGIGVYASNFRERMDKMAYVLHHPQRALVSTRGMRHLHSDEMPYGENVIVAVQSYTGYNIDDAIIVNRTAVQRGLLNVTHYQTLTVSESEPGDEVQCKFARDAPFPVVDARVREGDELVRMTRRSPDGTEEAAPKRAGDGEHGAVDAVHAYGGDARRSVKIKLRDIRCPELGDKLSSRHGQKGVVGMTFAAEDMPFTQTGLVPDVIITPMGMPSRMTVAHMMETVVGKLCCLLGVGFDATAFEGSRDEFEACCDLLQNRLGMQRYGDEIMYDGASGRQIRTDIFVGPCYYQRLKHMVADKINYRSTGGMMALTRQPLRGRTAGGGLRIGEMEEHSLLGHGALSFLKESFMERSDGTTFGVDGQGRLVSAADVGGGAERSVAVPYSFKLLTQELGAMGMDMSLSFDSFDAAGGDGTSSCAAVPGGEDGSLDSDAEVDEESEEHEDNLRGDGEDSD